MCLSKEKKKQAGRRNKKRARGDVERKAAKATIRFIRLSRSKINGK